MDDRSLWSTLPRDSSLKREHISRLFGNSYFRSTDLFSHIMAQIFGDTTDDITFGNAPSPSKPLPIPQKNRAPAPSSPSVQSSVVPQPRAKAVSHAQFEPRNTKVRPLSTPEPTSIVSSLATLIESMKPSYLPNFSDGLIRLVVLSEPIHEDPFLLIRSDDVSLIFGTGFGSIENAGKKYVTFPDLRLVSSEKDRLAGWILTRE